MHVQGAWTPSLSPPPPLLFTAALKGCPEAAAFCSMPCYHCIHEQLCCSPTVHALPSPAGPVLSLSQTCFNSRLQPLPACLPAAAPARRTMCHRPSLPAMLLAKDMLWHSCLPPPLLQSCRFGLLCTLLMSSSCRDPAPHRRSK